MNSLRLGFAIFCMVIIEQQHPVLSVFSQPFKIEKSEQLPISSTTHSSSTSASSTTRSTALTFSSTSSSTPLPTTTARTSATTIKPASTNATNSTTTQLKPEVNLKQRTFTTYQCECDLEIHLCSINCCCDVDCSTEMMKSFLCGNQDPLKEKAFHQGLPSCQINDGWLCIFKDNSIKENKDRYDDRFVAKFMHSWPNFFVDNDALPEEREHLVYGDDIMMFNKDTSEVKPLDLPASLVNLHCHISEPVRHLINFARTCMMTSDEFQTFFTTFFDEIGSYKLLRSRKGQLNSEELTDKSNLVGINSFVCSLDGDQKSCIKMENQTLTQNQGCWKFIIDIHHNFTYVVDMNVSLICNADSEFAGNTAKSFSVRFLQPNESVSNENPINGKFGYFLGTPVITGKFILAKDADEESDKNYLISYFHPNTTIRRTSREIHLPSSVSGLCSDAFREPIKFHENSLSQCAITTANNTILSEESNFTKICENLQDNAFKYLINDERFAGDYDLYVSELGRPINVSSNWIRMESRNFDQRQVLGKYDADTNSFRCINMILSVYYEFITARLAVNHALHQNVIKKATIEFGDRVNLRFSIDEDLSLPLYVYVRFFDATKSNSQKSSQITYLLNIILLVIVFTWKYTEAF